MTAADVDVDQRPDPSRRRWGQRFAWIVVTARRQHWGLLFIVVIVSLAVGMLLGRAFSPADGPKARAAIDANVLPIVLDADGIWTAGAEGRAAVSDALVSLRRDGDPSLVDENIEAWLAAYDSAIVRLAGADLPVEARSVQRQFLTAVTFSRDAVEVLAHAAHVDDSEAREDFVTEVGRLRSRSEQLMQAARASTADLDGRRTDLAPLPELDGFVDVREP